jgi:HAD superfamily hydrolase (TIGR01549 family)
MDHSNQPEIKAALFDWDLTLGAALGSVSSGERTSTLFRRLGMNYGIEAIVAAMAQRRQAIEQGVSPGPLAPQTKEMLIRYYQQLLHILDGAEASLQLGEQIYDEYARLPFVFYSDTLPAFQALAARAIRLGIITNHSPQIRPVIEEKLQEFVRPEHIIISGELDLYKPDPAIFVEAAIRLEIPVEQCLYVGDNLEVDAIGAVTAGGYACGLWCDRSDQPAPEKFPPAVYRITELGQVLDWVDSRR